MVPFVLASSSPRRSELLERVGLVFSVRPAEIDESLRLRESPAGYVARLASEKAAAVARPGEIVLAADTTVEIDGQILGKPTDDNDARRMLALLSGKVHHVHTGVSVVAESTTTIVIDTAVTFVEIDDEMLDWYITTGEPEGKAGGYAIQGAGGALVERLDGSFTNVIGLPLPETLRILRAASLKMR